MQALSRSNTRGPLAAAADRTRLHMDDDRAIIDAYRAWRTAEREANEAGRLRDLAESAAREAFPPCPPHLCRLERLSSGKQLDVPLSNEEDETAERYLRWVYAPIGEDYVQKAIAELREYKAACARVLQARGVPALEQAEAQALERAAAARQRFLDTPSRTIMGVALKLQLADEYTDFSTDGALAAADPTDHRVAPVALAAALKDATRLAGPFPIE